MSLWTHLKKVLNMLVMPCWFGSVPFSELVAVGKLVFEAEVLVESARGVFVVIGAGVERDWSLDLEHCLYQHRPTQTPIPNQLQLSDTTTVFSISKCFLLLPNEKLTF